MASDNPNPRGFRIGSTLFIDLERVDLVMRAASEKMTTIYLSSRPEGLEVPMSAAVHKQFMEALEIYKSGG